MIRRPRDPASYLLEIHSGSLLAINHMRNLMRSRIDREREAVTALNSTVREALKIGFAGGTYEHIFYVADVEATGSVMNGKLHLGLDKSDFLALLPLKKDGRVRLVGTVSEEALRQREELTGDDINKRVIEWMPIKVARVNWFSTYHVHHRVAERFEKAGRSCSATPLTSIAPSSGSV
jgi:hypothetical protein